VEKVKDYSIYTSRRIKFMREIERARLVKRYEKMVREIVSQKD